MTQAIQNALQTIIQGATGFSADDVTLGDYRVMDRGSSPYAVILPGPFEAERPGDWARVRFRWRVYVDVIAAFQGDDYTGLNTAREAVINRVNAYPTLNNLNTGGFRVTNVMIVAGDDLKYIYPRGGSEQPQFVSQRLTVTADQDQAYSTGEYA